MLIRPCVQNVPGKNGELSLSGYGLNPRESDPKFVQGQGGVTTSLTLLGPVLVWSQQNYLRFLLIAGYFGSSQGCSPRVSPEKKSGHENEKMNECEGLH